MSGTVNMNFTFDEKEGLTIYVQVILHTFLFHSTALHSAFVGRIMQILSMPTDADREGGRVS